MRKIIIGRIYDTENATEILEGEEYFDEDLGQKIVETLYRSPGQRFFLLITDTFSGDEDIKLVSERDAIEWLSNQNAGEDAYERAGIELEMG